MTTELAHFSPQLSETILGWAKDPADLEYWCGLAISPSPEVFTLWHADEDMTAYVLRKGGVAIAYGEAWVEGEELELGRLIVAPQHRGTGVVAELITQIMTLHPSRRESTFVRVRFGNSAAEKAYQRVGFKRVCPEAQRRYNEGQPSPCLWMQFESVE